ncbi:MAG TPA: DUF523 domain-containing protein [Paucimonas sp.]|nr:DUF523 domain-containing protein [Paucimonas sp.]
MTRILVSACLLGAPVRYDGGHLGGSSDVLAAWQRAGRLVPFCPEVAAGFPTPRPAAEIRGGGGGAQVLARGARVVEESGRDVSAQFIAGAEQALALAQRNGVRLAILAEGSPSCGSTAIYDGSFGGRLIEGSGVTAALLESAGIRVFSQHRLAEAAAWLDELEAAERGPG